MASDMTTSGTTSSRPRPHPSQSRRRDKPQLSCNFCRSRKSRCDRKQPCANCASRGQTCVYPNTKTMRLQEQQQQQQQSSQTSTTHIHDRLVQLENLVTTLKQRSNASTDSTAQLARSGAPSFTPSSGGPRTPDTCADELSETGSMRISSSQLRYMNGDHWTAILDSIADIKDHASRDAQAEAISEDDEMSDHLHRDVSSCPSEQDFSSGRRSDRVLLLYGCHHAISREDIIASLPPKPIIDRCLPRYFKRLSLSSTMIHATSFLKDYESFWKDSTKASIVWVGLLFSVICLAVQTSDGEDVGYADAEQQAQLIQLFREKVVQCLTMGRYTDAPPYAYETMGNYLYIEFLLFPDAKKDIWFILGIFINLARRIGLHRDPKHFDHINPFQGEMRRRMWATVVLCDITLSSQMGMPRMICDSQYDTAEPRNLNDSDLDADNPTLIPPSRPESEHTTATICIAHRRMLFALGVVVDFNASVKPHTYAEILQIDKTLNDALDSVPSVLRMDSSALRLLDPPEVVMSRLFIQLLYHKGQFALHGRFLHRPEPKAQAQEEHAFGYNVGVWKTTKNADTTHQETNDTTYSRKVCLNAALGTLEIQHSIEQETRPGGQLQYLRWRVTSGMNGGFLTATMILCQAARSRIEGLHRADEIIPALRRAGVIWKQRSSLSQEAKRAVEVINAIIAKTESHADGGNPPAETMARGMLDATQNQMTGSGESAFASPPLSATPDFFAHPAPVSNVMNQGNFMVPAAGSTTWPNLSVVTSSLDTDTAMMSTDPWMLFDPWSTSW